MSIPPNMALSRRLESRLPSVQGLSTADRGVGLASRRTFATGMRGGIVVRGAIPGSREGKAARRSQLTIRTGLWNNWSVTAGRGIGGREDPLATPKSPPPLQ